MVIMPMLIVGGIFLTIWFSVAIFVGILGFILFLWGLIKYHQISLNHKKISQYIKIVIGIVLLIISLFGLCALFPLEIFASCLTALAGFIVLCFVVPKRLMLPKDKNHKLFNIAIVVGIVLIVVPTVYMTISGIALIIKTINTIVSYKSHT